MNVNATEICSLLLEYDQEMEDFISGALSYKVKYLVFQTGTGPYGSGGWSRYAKHRPQPTIVFKQTPNVKFVGKSVFVDGVRRLKANVWDWSGKPVRIDYPDLRLEQ